MIISALLMYTVGTVVAMEKEAGILKEQHITVIEGLRDKIERDLKRFRDNTHKSPS